MHRIVRHFQIDPSRLATDITATLDKLPRGATAISDFAPADRGIRSSAPGCLPR